MARQSETQKERERIHSLASRLQLSIRQVFSHVACSWWIPRDVLVVVLVVDALLASVGVVAGCGSLLTLKAYVSYVLPFCPFLDNVMFSRSGWSSSMARHVCMPTTR